MSDRILAVEEKEVVEQVDAYLKMLTPQQKREFALLIRGAMVAMQSVERKDKQFETLT
ncbi:hypothetical protein SAMN06295926_10311 [Lysinibacillus sp. AC-3]|uniref:hypothetical protein n=1 Tax=unclassified Lysinibacillus TaxID=2636778 RepID=UPI0009D3380C|nr:MULTISPECIES: hypothetical protein [unclassified Lysinibacillus]SKB49825.1 hypothetical protein SAMN06295926_10311 [Lysinibacillus sp. AC-3]